MKKAEISDSPQTEPHGASDGAPLSQPLAGAGQLTTKVDLVQLIEQPEWKTILIGLVSSEKMDPWGIDLCELADKYLKKINSMRTTDLRLPANAILASAILLKFKSRVLRLSDIDEDLELAAQMQKEQALMETELPELVAIRKVREGKVTLDELVESIEKVLEKTKSKSSLKLTRDADEIEFRLPILGAGFGQVIEEVYALVKKNADSQGLAMFSRLVHGKDALFIVNTFLSLLLLAHQGKVTVWQEDFFGEVFVNLVKEGKGK